MLKTKFGLIDTSKLEIISDITNEYIVYKLSEDKVLKVSNGNHKQNSGKVLEELQGIPFVPKLYDYDEDYLITQRIVGEDLISIMLTSNFGLPDEFSIPEFDYERHKVNCFLFWDFCIAKGWLPGDVETTNVMIHEDGGFWFIDYGRFKRIDPIETMQWVAFRSTPEADLPKGIQSLLSWGEWLRNKYNKQESVR